MTKADANKISGELLRAGGFTDTAIVRIICSKKRTRSAENLGRLHIRVHYQEITTAHEALECKLLASQLSLNPLELIEELFKKVCVGTVHIGPSNGNRYPGLNIYIRRMVLYSERLTSL